MDALLWPWFKCLFSIKVRNKSVKLMQLCLRYTDSDCPFGIFKLFLLHPKRPHWPSCLRWGSYPSGIPDATLSDKVYQLLEAGLWFLMAGAALLRLKYWTLGHNSLLNVENCVFILTIRIYKRGKYFVELIAHVL